MAFKALGEEDMTRELAKDVATRTAAEQGYSLETLIRSDRTKTVSWARHRTIFAVYCACPHLSLPQIGRLFGGRDHTTILNSLWRVCEADGLDYSEIRKAGPVMYVRPSYKHTPTTAEDYRRVSRLPPQQTSGNFYGSAVAA